MRERRIASTARRVRLELFRPASQVERASHGGIAFGVRGADLRVIAVRAEEPCLRRVAWRYVHLELGCVVPKLGEPESVLVHQVEGQAVPPRRDRAANLDV